MSLLRQVTRKQATRQRYGSWQQVTEEKIIQGAETQMLRTYVDRRQVTVAEWGTTRPIFDVCAREMGYNGGGRLRVMWWRQKAVEDKLRVTVEAILAAARVHQ